MTLIKAVFLRLMMFHPNGLVCVYLINYSSRIVTGWCVFQLEIMQPNYGAVHFNFFPRLP